MNYSYSELMTAEEICDASTKLVTFLDLAGHKKYIHTTIQGLSGYSPHYAMLVVSLDSNLILYHFLSGDVLDFKRSGGCGHDLRAPDDSNGTKRPFLHRNH